MATYNIPLKRKVQKYSDGLAQKQPNDAAAVEEALGEMIQDPWAGDVKKLRGVSGYRRRVRNYRIIFRVESENATVFVEAIDLHHRAY